MKASLIYQQHSLAFFLPLPLSVSLLVFPCPSVYLCLSLSLYQFLCVSLCIFLCISLSLGLRLPLYHSLYLALNSRMLNRCIPLNNHPFLINIFIPLFLLIPSSTIISRLIHSSILHTSLISSSSILYSPLYPTPQLFILLPHPLLLPQFSPRIISAFFFYPFSSPPPPSSIFPPHPPRVLHLSLLCISVLIRSASYLSASASGVCSYNFLPSLLSSTVSQR